MVCLLTGTMEGASCVLFYQSGRRSRHPRAPSTGKTSTLSCEFLLFSRTNSRALGNLCRIFLISFAVASRKRYNSIVDEGAVVVGNSPLAAQDEPQLLCPVPCIPKTPAFRAFLSIDRVARAVLKARPPGWVMLRIGFREEDMHLQGS